MDGAEELIRENDLSLPVSKATLIAVALNLVTRNGLCALRAPCVGLSDATPRENGT